MFELNLQIRAEALQNLDKRKNGIYTEGWLSGADFQNTEFIRLYHEGLTPQEIYFKALEPVILPDLNNPTPQDLEFWKGFKAGVEVAKQETIKTLEENEVNND